jgi:hypothetical protein
MRLIILLFVCLVLAGCQANSKSYNSQYNSPSFTENRTWDFNLFTDSFTEKKECRLSYEYRYDENIGIHKKTLLLIKAAIPNKSPGTISVSYNESERVASFSKMFGKINYGPYTPWPRLNINADIKLGDKVSQAYITSSDSTAEDQYTSSVHKRLSTYEFGYDFLKNASSEQTFSLRLNGIIYTVPQNEFQSFINCIGTNEF